MSGHTTRCPAGPAGRRNRVRGGPPGSSARRFSRVVRAAKYAAALGGRLSSGAPFWYAQITTCVLPTRNGLTSRPCRAGRSSDVSIWDSPPSRRTRAGCQGSQRRAGCENPLQGVTSAIRHQNPRAGRIEGALADVLGAIEAELDDVGGAGRLLFHHHGERIRGGAEGARLSVRHPGQVGGGGFAGQLSPRRFPTARGRPPA